MPRRSPYKPQHTLVPNYIPDWMAAYHIALSNAPEHPQAASYPDYRRKGYMFNRHYIPFNPHHGFVWLQMVGHALNLERRMATFVLSNDHLATLCQMGITDLNLLMAGLQVLGLVTRAHRGPTRTMMTFLHLNPLLYDESRASRTRRKVDDTPTPYQQNEESIEEVAKVLTGILEVRDKKSLIPKGKGRYKLLVALRDCFAQTRCRYGSELAAPALRGALSQLFREGAAPTEVRLADALLESPDFCLMLPELYPEILGGWAVDPLTNPEQKEAAAS